MDKSKKEVKDKNKILSEKQLKKQIREQEGLSLIFSADTLLPNRGTDANLDFALEKIELRSGKIVSLKDIRNVIAENRQVHFVMFVQDFYKQMCRLKGLKYEPNRRPYIFAKYTIELIYARFDKSVLPTLEYKNPYNEFGFRNYKHFQFLNEQGIILLGGFISNAVETMKEYTNWYEFRINYAKQNGLPIQLKLWETESANY